VPSLPLPIQVGRTSTPAATLTGAGDTASVSFNTQSTAATAITADISVAGLACQSAMTTPTETCSGTTNCVAFYEPVAAVAAATANSAVKAAEPAGLDQQHLPWTALERPLLPPRSQRSGSLEWPQWGSLGLRTIALDVAQVWWVGGV
jgi:hypothetical protein